MYNAAYPHMRISRRTQYPTIYNRKKQLDPDRYSQRIKSKCDCIQHCRDSKGKQAKTLWIFPLPFWSTAKTWKIRRCILCRRAASVVQDTAEMLLPGKGSWKLIKFVSICRPQRAAFFLVRYWLWSIYLYFTQRSEKTIILCSYIHLKQCQIKTYDNTRI